MKKIIHCLNCNKEIEVNLSSKKKFCNQKCAGEYRSKQVEYIKLTCKQCGKEFKVPKRNISKNNPRMFCSRKCKDENWGRNRIEKICPVCGKKFLAQRNKAKYNFCCSPECSAKNPNNRIINNSGTMTLICQHCGKEFEKRVSYVKKQERRGQPVKFCSKECSLAAYGRTKKNMINTTCEVCGSHFQYKEGHKKRFCSQECRLKYASRDTVTLTCAFCGKQYKANGYKANVQHSKYCSRKCRNNAVAIAKDTYAKLQHYLRTSSKYLLWQRSVFKKANYACEECGNKENLHAHHKYELYNIAKDNDFDEQKILSSDIFNDIDNGECLCGKCHLKHHPYHKELRDNVGRFCRRKFKSTNKV